MATPIQRLRSLLLPLALLLPATLLRAQAPAWTGAIELSPTGDNGYATGQRVATGPGGALYNAGILRGTATFGNLPALAQSGTNYLARLDPTTGAWQWALPIGGNGSSDLVTLDTDPVTGNVLVAGAPLNNFYGGAYLHSFGAIQTLGYSFLACASPTGQWLWAVPVGSSSTVRAATWDGAGGVAVAGHFSGILTLGSLTATATPSSISPTNERDGFVAHLSATQQWDALLQSVGTEIEEFNALAFDPATGTATVGGFTNSPTTTFGPATLTQTTSIRQPGLLARARLTGAGGPAWLDVLPLGNPGEDGRPTILRFDSAGQLLVLGGASGNLTLGGTSAVAGLFVARFNPVSRQWGWVASVAANPNTSRFSALVLAPGGDVWIGGEFKGTLTFGPATITNPQTTAFGELGFVARLDGATGAWQTATALTGAAQQVLDVAVAPNGTTLYTTGAPLGQATVAVFGNTALMGGDGTAYIGALDIAPTGALAWRWTVAPTVGGGTLLDRFVRDGAGNLTVVGTYFRRLTLGGTTLTAPNAAGFVAQCTPGGQWRWVLALPPFSVADQGPLLATDGAGNVYVGGVVNSSVTAVGPFPVNVPTSRRALCVASLDAAGNWRWATTALVSQRSGLFAADLAAGPNGHPTVTGFFQDTLTIGATRLVGTGRGAGRVFDDYVARLDATTGQWQWAAQVRGRSNKFAKSVAVDGRGGAVMAGFGSDTVRFGAITLDPIANQGPFVLLPHVARLSPVGQWLTAAGVTPLMPNQGQIGGNVFVATNDTGDALVTGNLTPNALLFGPHLLTSPYHGSAVPFVARLSGQPYQWQWVHALADTLAVGGYQSLFTTSRHNTVLPALDAAGNAYLGGNATGRLPFPGMPLLPLGSFPAVLKLNPAGQALWLATTTNANATDYNSAAVNALVVTPAGQSIIGGLYSGPIQFGATTLTRYSYYNSFIAGLGVPLAVAPPLPTDLPTADLWPNPARTAATLRLPMPAPGATSVQLVDGLGRVVSTVPVAAGTTTVALPLTGLAPGLYVVRGAGHTQRLVVGGE